MRRILVTGWTTPVIHSLLCKTAYLYRAVSLFPHGGRQLIPGTLHVIWVEAICKERKELLGLLRGLELVEVAEARIVCARPKASFL
jgi:hypothetical protein